MADRTGIKRQTLYKALSASGNPTIDTAAKVVEALGFRLGVHPIAVAHAAVKPPRAA